MTVTTEDGQAGGGPVPRWSPRRWAHHRNLWWTGALVVLVTVVLLCPFVLFGALHTWRRRTARPTPHGRLPEDLGPDAVAFVRHWLGELEEHLGRVRSYGREVGAAPQDDVADAWAGHGNTATTAPRTERASA
jgi:hypothetical protein